MALIFLTRFGKSAVYDCKNFVRGISNVKGLLTNQTIVYKHNNKQFLVFRHNYGTNPDTDKKSLPVQQQSKSDLSEDVRPITFNTVKETTKTASYLGVILLGIGVTGIMFYAVFSELFSSSSPNSIYSKALERVCSDTRVQDALGEPISGYGEENRRGRRQHVSHLFYEKDGEKRIRMKFYISGTRKRATVHLEMKQDESGKFVYRYLFVELDDFGRHPIMFEDNRYAKSGSVIPGAQIPIEELDLSAPLNMNLNFPDAGLK